MRPKFVSSVGPSRLVKSPIGRVFSSVIAVLAGLCLAPALFGQTQTDDDKSISPVPIFSAGLAYNSFVNGGTQNVHPLASPVVLIPFGQNWLN